MRATGESMGKAGSGPNYLALAFLLLAVKAGWLLADPTAMLFLGDSDTYIATAVNGLIPLDRSFVYGFFVRVFAVWPHSLTPLVVFQSLCSVFAGLIFAWTLRSSFQAPPWIACLGALTWALLEPIALLHERYVMAEAVALPFFALFIAFGLRYVDTRNLRWLLAVHAAGVATLSLRYSFVPVAWAAAVLLPSIAFAARSDGQVGTVRISTWMRFLVHLGFSVAAMLLMHQAFKAMHGRLQQLDPAYNYAEGLFLVSAVAPVLAPEDFDAPALGQLVSDLRKSSTCPIEDRRFREFQRWAPGCLCERILSHFGGDAGYFKANSSAHAAALRAIRRDPIGVAGLALQSWSDWFDRNEVLSGLHWDRWESPYGNPTRQTLRTHFGIQDTPLWALSTPTNRWYFASVPWIRLLALSPLVLLLGLIAVPRGFRRPMIWIAAIVACIVAMNVGVATRPVPRYMHTVAWLFPLALCALAAQGRRCRGSRRLSSKIAS